MLAVDDEPDGRDLVTALLHQVGYNVVTAASGEEALAMAVKRPPDLVVLDVVLPGIDGFETCRRLKRQLGASLPVLMLSGRGRSAVIQGLGAGADDYLPKPFDVEEFWARVEALLRIRSAETAARRRAERLLSLARLSTAVTGRLDEVEVMQLVLGEALRLLDAEGAAFYVWDPSQQVLRRRQVVGVANPDAFSVRRPGEGVTGQAFERRQPIWVNDYGDWPSGRLDAQAAGTRAAVAAPLLFGDEALGVLVAWQTHPNMRFDGEDAQLLGLLAGQAAASLNVARMYAAERAAATRAAERAAQLVAIGESMADGILIVDGAGTITSVNGAAVELLGRSREQMVGSPAALGLPGMRWPDGNPVTAEGLPLMAVLRRGRPSVDRELIVDVAGRERILIDTTVPLRGPDGQMAGAVSVFRDVTERRQADERQVEAEKLRALGQMASGVAHDVNNLLAGVLGRAELARLEIERGHVDPERVVESLRLIEQAAEDGAHTVRRIQ
ncbi:MAG: response regulator, partial [Chloroflexi bacterium]|nr:response regulator [Chloroflexota bacterium]